MTWAVFVVDYVARFVLSTDRRAFVRHNLLDLAVLALPVLRPLRLLRLLALLAILNRAGANSLRGRVVVYVMGGTILLVVCGALAITDAERNRPGANIAHIGDGLWWAVTTMTTVGYGDRYPVTTTGRFIAAALMVGGIALLGVVTATLASWLVQRVAEVGDEDEAATRAQVDALAMELSGAARAAGDWPGGHQLPRQVTVGDLARGDPLARSRSRPPTPCGCHRAVGPDSRSPNVPAVSVVYERRIISPRTSRSMSSRRVT